jgi:hypothetical protein
MEEQPKKRSEMEHFRARMNLPIGTSSVGIPHTPEIKAEIERYAKEIDRRIKDGLLRDWDKPIDKGGKH